MNRIRGRGESKRRVSLPCRRARFSPTIRLGEFLTYCEIVLRTFLCAFAQYGCPIWRGEWPLTFHLSNRWRWCRPGRSGSAGGTAPGWTCCWSCRCWWWHGWRSCPAIRCAVRSGWTRGGSPTRCGRRSGSSGCSPRRRRSGGRCCCAWCRTSGRRSGCGCCRWGSRWRRRWPAGCSAASSAASRGCWSGWPSRSCLACVPAMLVSNTTVFVSAAVLGALALRELWRRDWLRLAWVLAGGAGVVAVEGLVYATFAAGGNNAGMRAFWAHAFVPLSAGPGRAAGFVVTASRLELARIGFGPPLLAGALVVAGLVVLWRSGRPVVAGAVVLLAAEQVAAAAARLYPLFDIRTSMFFSVLLTACAALAVGSFVAWAWRRAGTAPLGIAAAVLAAILVVPAMRASQQHQMPLSRMR